MPLSILWINKSPSRAFVLYQLTLVSKTVNIQSYIVGDNLT